MTGRRHTRLPDCGLYAITDHGLQPNITALTTAVRSAIAGGARLIQYRDKGHDCERRLREATALTEVCRGADVPLIINDDIDLALASEADGVHLGRDDPDLPEARRRLGRHAIIGVSCYDDLPRARTAVERGANYVVFGSLFSSATKPAASRAPLEILGAARRELRVPVGAIGGITPGRAPAVIAAGADLLAVIRAVFARDDIEAAARAFAVHFPDHGQRRNPEYQAGN